MRNVSTDTITLGKTTIITDPCNEKGVMNNSVLIDTLPGEYVVKENSKGFGKRYELKGLFIVHKSSFGKKQYLDCGEGLSHEIWVDSGECGIYDAEHYPRCGIEINQEAAETDSPVYRIPDGNWGVTAGCFGGDGSYKGYVSRNESGIIDAIYIDFSYEGEDDFLCE